MILAMITRNELLSQTETYIGRVVCAYTTVENRNHTTCKNQVNLNGAISTIFTFSQQEITRIYLQGLNEVVDQNQ